MVLPSSGAISVNDIATEYEIGTGTPIGFDRIKTISTNWSGASIGLDQFYSLDRDDLVGNSTPTQSVAGLGSFTTFSTIYTMSFRVAVGLSATTNGNIVNTGNVNSEGVAIYTWNGKLYARAGDGTKKFRSDNLSFTIPVSWTTDQIRIVVVTFCFNKSVNNEELGTNLLFVDGILRNQSTMNSFEKVTSTTEGGKTGVVNAAGFGVNTRMSNNDLSYEAPSAIISAQVWYDRIGYVPAYNTGTVKGNYFIYENSNVYIVFTSTSTQTLGLYDIGPNALPDVRYLMVAGGGGGGDSGQSGGGGGGGILFDDTGVALAAGTYTVNVGNGGGRGNPGGNGGDTTFHTYTALGGGGGASIKTATKNNFPGQNGGTGGGGGSKSAYSSTSVGGTGSQGGDGGDGTIYSGTGYGGGGGGGGADGQNGMKGETLGKPVRPWGSGGDGTQYSWGHLGETATYYGGGGAGQNSDASERSLGGGGWNGPGGKDDGEDTYGGGAYANADGGSGHATFRIPWTLPTS
jgi:hypothetical protein